MIGRCREVNCSLEITSWSLHIFRSSEHATDDSILKLFEIVTLHDPETRSNVIVAFKDAHEEDDDEEASNIKQEFDASDENSVQDMDFEIERSYDAGHVLIEPEGNFKTANSLWVVEPEYEPSGHPLTIKGTRIRFRHLIRDTYVRIEYSEIVMKTSKVFGFVSTTDDRNDPGTLFNIQELYSMGQFMLNGKPVQLVQENSWLGRGDMVRNTTSYQCTTSFDKAQAASWIINRYNPNTYGISTDVLEREPLDVNVCLVCKVYLRKFLNMIVLPSDEFATTIMPSADADDLDFFQLLMGKLVMFIQGYPISYDVQGINVDDEFPCPNEKLRLERQFLAREVGILQLCLLMLNKLIKISVEGDRLELMSKGTTTAAKKAQVVIPQFIQMGKQVLSRIFGVVYQGIRDNPENQLYIADFLPVLLTHLGTQKYAGTCVNEMLSKNMALQEEKIGTREISIFISKLRASKMNPMYLKLLQSCCSCQGEGVDGNQGRVADLLFEDLNDVIILLQADFTHLFRPTWNQESLYLIWEPVAGSPMIGQELVTKGVPRLSLSWTTNSIEFSPLGLFGKLSVPIEVLYFVSSGRNSDNADPDWLTNKASKSKKKSKAEIQKLAVAEYFVNQLYLCAEMCLDRNYIGMLKLQPLFPFNSLVAIFKHNVNDEVKAAAVTLLQCLYVDRDPQCVTFLPRLTRAYSELGKTDTSELSVVNIAHINSFAILQDIISDHVKEMRNKQWSVLSKRVLSLLKVLVKFGFYGTQDRLVDLVGPLVLCLDRRQMQFIEKSAPSSKVGNKLEKNVDLDELDETAEEQTGISSGEVEGEEKESWQKRLLNILEGVHVLIAVLSLVGIAVIITIYTIISGIDDSPGTWIFVVGNVILALFILEVTLRIYCTYAVRKQLWGFLADPLNYVDITVIVIDIVFLCLPTGGNNAGYVKTLRLLRLVRLLRLIRAAKLINELSKFIRRKVTFDWKVPLRYKLTHPREVDAMVEAIDILCYTAKIIDDRNVSVLLRGFYLWESGESQISPLEAFQNTLESSKDLKMHDGEFDAIICDLLMFNNKILVQGVLDILVAHYSVAQILLENFNKVQLLVSPKNERKFMLISQILRQLESNAETQELWGNLATSEDRLMSTQTHNILDELLDLCRVRLDVYHMDFDYAPDQEIQNLLGNLGAFEVFFKIFDLLETIESDSDDLSEVDANTKLLVSKCMSVMYWFTWGAPANQRRAFDRLDFFVETLEDGIDSHLVVGAIFYNNEEIMRMCPRQMIQQMVQNICVEGRNPEYLTLLRSITNIGDKNIAENQFEVVKQLLAPAKLPKISQYLCPLESQEYSEKLKLMNKFKNMKNVKIEDLPKELSYHIYLLDVLSCCTIGRANMASIEAKVQAVYDYQDCIDAILDPECIIVIKTRLSLHLYNSAIDVEVMVPGLEYNVGIWNILATYPEVWFFSS